MRSGHSTQAAARAGGQGLLRASRVALAVCAYAAAACAVSPAVAACGRGSSAPPPPHAGSTEPAPDQAAGDLARGPAPGPDAPPRQAAATPSAPAAPPDAAPDDLVDVVGLEPGIRLDIRYATTNNFTGEAVYPAARCLLRRAVAERLIRVHRALSPRGLGLLVWDCYRPISVQQKLWRLVPDPRYVARPVIRDGVPVSGSKHNRGAAVDLTLVRADGAAVAMPTDYDDFSPRAHRGDAKASPEARANAATLSAAMEAEGFEPLPTEWWHFDGPGWRDYPLSDAPL